MPIVYTKLFDLLKEKGYTTYKIRQEKLIGQGTLTAIKNGTGKCELLSTTSRWFGVTFKEDRPGVVAKFQEFADNGTYPTPLYK